MESSEETKRSYILQLQNGLLDGLLLPLWQVLNVFGALQELPALLSGLSGLGLGSGQLEASNLTFVPLLPETIQFDCVSPEAWSLDV